MLSPMPPSSDTYLRTVGIVLIAPTVYSATPARPTMERPGSTISFGSPNPKSPQRRLNAETMTSA